MSLTELLQWWNLIFVLPFGLAAMLLLLMSTGLLGLDEGDADTDVNLDADVDVDMDADVDVDADAEHDVATHGHGFGLHDSHWHAEEISHEHGGLMKALEVLGVGRAPISLLLMCFCFVWGFTGFASNILLEGVLRSPLIYVWLSMGGALLASLFFTRAIAFAFAKLLSLDQSYNVPRHHLVGQRADVRFTITENSGTAMLYDAQRTLREVPCRVQPGEPALHKGERVVLLRFDPRQKVFWVRPDPLAGAAKDGFSLDGGSTHESQLGSGSTHPPPNALT